MSRKLKRAGSPLSEKEDEEDDDDEFGLSCSQVPEVRQALEVPPASQLPRSSQVPHASQSPRSSQVPHPSQLPHASQVRQSKVSLESLPSLSSSGMGEGGSASVKAKCPAGKKVASNRKKNSKRQHVPGKVIVCFVFVLLVSLHLLSV